MGKKHKLLTGIENLTIKSIVKYRYEYADPKKQYIDRLWDHWA